MDESVLIVFGILGAVCITLVVSLVLILSFRKSSIIAVEQERTDRDLRKEEATTERERLRSEKTAMYVNRDIVSAQLEAGMLGQSKATTGEDESGLSAILKNALPLLMQNPELLTKVSGLLRPGAVSAKPGAGEAPSQGTFPPVQT